MCRSCTTAGATASWTRTAIRDFLRAAVGAWQRPPIAAVLVGDGTHDPRNIPGPRQPEPYPAVPGGRGPVDPRHALRQLLCPARRRRPAVGKRLSARHPHRTAAGRDRHRAGRLSSTRSCATNVRRVAPLAVAQRLRAIGRRLGLRRRHEGRRGQLPGVRRAHRRNAAARHTLLATLSTTPTSTPACWTPTRRRGSTTSAPGQSRTRTRRAQPRALHSSARAPVSSPSPATHIIGFGRAWATPAAMTTGCSACGMSRR